jgi:hypothetical protein
MRITRFKRKRSFGLKLFQEWRIWPFAVACLGLFAHILTAQNENLESLSQHIQKLTEAMATTQAQLEQSQRQIIDMQKQLKALQQEMAQRSSTETSPVSPGSASPASAPESQPTDIQSEAQDIRDRQAMQESQIATLEQTKIESESKYPVKVAGLLLLSGFVNTRAVDMAAAPTLALPGPGNTEASVRQTVLGFDARGPHLFGANSYADLRVDFDGVPQSSAGASTYSGPYSANPTPLRLRTAHAGLQWERTEAYFSLDHPIFNPDTPASLTAIAQPALAWSGNLWTWNPQIGARQDVPISSSHDIRLEAALIDVGDAPLSPTTYTEEASTGGPPNSAEQSRWPGAEARLALVGSGLNAENRSHFGLGGYFARHRPPIGKEFDSWAATLDTRILLPARLELAGTSYRGLALGGLGGGAFKDFEYSIDSFTGNYFIHPLDDVGGWAQLKEKISERVELNAAFGIDDAFAAEVRRYSVPTGTMYQNLSRNRTYTGNVIYRPSAYLLFSLEYRHLESSAELSPAAESNVIGLGAGFKF